MEFRVLPMRVETSESIIEGSDGSCLIWYLNPSGHLEGHSVLMVETAGSDVLCKAQAVRIRVHCVHL